MGKIYYVRGYVCERIPTVVMVVAEDEHDASIKAVDRAGITGKNVVIIGEDWEGILPGENFIIGFKGE